MFGMSVSVAGRKVNTATSSSRKASECDWNRKEEIGIELHHTVVKARVSVLLPRIFPCYFMNIM